MSTFKCNDDGFYFLTTDTAWTGGSGRCAWFGYHPDLRWANVFWGRAVQNGQFVDGMKGKWCDVTFGRSLGHGEISVDFELGAPPPDMRRIDATGGFGGSMWFEDNSNVRLPERLPYGQSAPREDGPLNGIWTADTGAFYYIRELPGTGEVFWYAARHDHSAIHVAHGHRNGDSVTVGWVDVPPSGTRYVGDRLELELLSDRKMVKRNQSQSFGASEWHWTV